MIDSQLKKLIRLKYLIFETPYTFFSIFSWYFSPTHTSHFITFVFRHEKQQLFLFRVRFYNFKKENIYF